MEGAWGFSAGLSPTHPGWPAAFTKAVADDLRDGVAGSTETGDIGLIGAGHFFGGLVENVEVVTVSRGVGRGIEHKATGEMAEFIPVRGDDAEDFALETRYRHDCNACASRHSLCPPFCRSPAMTNGMSSSVISIAGSDDQKQSA